MLSSQACKDSNVLLKFNHGISLIMKFKPFVISVVLLCAGFVTLGIADEMTLQSVKDDPTKILICGDSLIDFDKYSVRFRADRWEIDGISKTCNVEILRNIY